MNQITLDVKLFSGGNEKDILAFGFEDELKVNLNSDSCQAELKTVFSKLIELSINNDVTLQFVIDDNYSRGLYIDVCSEYIKELQHELDKVKDRIRKEMAE